MEQKNTKPALLSSLIGTPEIKVSLSNKTIALFFGALVVSLIIIFLAHAIIKKQ